jgi:hypothetical protein
MPMLPGYEAIRATVARAVERAGFDLRRLEVLLSDPEWQLWLLDALPQAAFALVDVTDHNPFVMYELGLAHSRRVPAILCMNARNPSVTATVLGSPFLPYEDEGLEATEAALVRWMTLQAEVAQVSAASRQELADDVRYATGLALVERFCADAGVWVQVVSRDEFRLRCRVAEGRGDLRLTAGHPQWLALQLLPRMVQNADDTALMRALVAWSLSSGPVGVLADGITA